MPILEICVDSVASSLAAEAGGAQRIELCSALSEGGLTPSLGLLGAVRSKVGIGVHVMIRPRGGLFVYSDDEFAVMRDDISIAMSAGADGVVLGLLTRDRVVDVARTRALVELARPMQVTFHRAIDDTRDAVEALETLIQIGVNRVLTSGGELKAMVGHEGVRQLVDTARSRIGVMACGSVRAENIAELVRLTGAHEWHTALRRPTASNSRMARTAKLGNGHTALAVEVEDVRTLRQALNKAFEAKRGVRSGAFVDPAERREETHGLED